jgi:AcrR family transcriptional regulator
LRNAQFSRYGGGVTEPGLRERKKRATRAALSWAALRLAAEVGLAEVTVEDIAAAAEVSPRTFHNYFHSKEAAIVAIAVDRAANTADALRATPPEVPLWPAVIAATVAQYRTEFPVDPEFAARGRAVALHPAVRAEFLRAHAGVETALAEAVAERIGAADGALYPALLAGVVVHATRTAIQFWRAGAAGEPLDVVIEHALTEVSRGLPAPDSRGN